MRHYPHNVGDYAAATRHLTFVEDAAYRRLLDRYYQDERPLPADIAECQRLAGARSKDEKAAVAAVLREFFHLEDDGWHQSRADREIAAYQAKADAARRNGAGGGRPRKPDRPQHHNPEKTDPVSHRGQTEKLTSNQEPRTKNQESVTPTESGGAIARARRAQLPTQVPDDIREQVLAERAKRLPDGWQPDAELAEWARKQRPDLTDAEIDRQTERFVRHARDKGRVSHDWREAYRGWITDARGKFDAGPAGESFEQRRIREGLEALKAP